jgi:hypothetical protein
MQGTFRGYFRGVLFFLSLVVILNASGCDDECKGKKRITADFRTFQELPYHENKNGIVLERMLEVDEDTFMVSSYVFFEALEQNALSYEWTIGSDLNKRVERKFNLYFDQQALVDNPISVKLKITKAANTECFSNETGVDSVTRLLYFLPATNWPVLGIYRGADDSNPDQLYEIEIFSDPVTEDVFIKNFPLGCNNNGNYVRVGARTAFDFALDIIPRSKHRLFF